MGSLLSRQGILIGLALAGVPLFVAVVMVASSAMRRRAVAPVNAASGGDAAAEEVLEELLADVQIGEDPSEQPPSPSGGGGDERGEGMPPKSEDVDGQKQESDEEEQADTESALGDLASLFFDEDTSLASLEQFCKGLPDVNAEDLLKMGRTIVERLSTSVRKSTEAAV